jgi:hypothetical protein
MKARMRVSSPTEDAPRGEHGLEENVTSIIDVIEGVECSLAELESKDDGFTNAQ